MEKELKVLMISSDRNVLREGSPVYQRMMDYGALVQELHIVLLSDISHGLREAPIGKNVWVYPTNSRKNFLRPLDAARIGKRLIRDKKFMKGKSVVTADSIECGWAGKQIKKKWRVPLEVQLHTNPFSPYFTGFQNMVRRFFLKRILKSADSVRVVAEDLRDGVSKVTDADIHVLPIFVDREALERQRSTFDLHTRFGWSFIILTVSRLTPEKNLPLAIESLSLVRNRFANIGLVIVGSGPEEESLKALVKKLNLESSVAFVGWQEDLASYYRTANVFLQTSLFEGYGLALVEAGVYGLPIVTTRVGIACELEDKIDAYIYTEADNSEIFAEGILDLINNNHKREILKNNLALTLKNKLISKEVYLQKLASIWVGVAKKGT